MIRVGLDTARAGDDLAAEVERGASAMAIVGPRSGRRVIRFRDFDFEADDAEGLSLAVQATLPMGRVLPGQLSLEARGELDMMRQATGIEIWLVAAGDLTEAWEPDGGPSGTPIAASAAA